MRDKIDSNGYRANVGIILCRDDGQLFLAGRVGSRGWQFPQGGIRKHEPPRKALFRELAEEVGLQASDVEVLGMTRGWLCYRLPPRYRRIKSMPHCVGQKQRWFMLRLVGREANVKLDSTDSPEFDRWRWVDYWDPVKEVIYFKRQVYAAALQEFAPLVFRRQIPPYPSWWSRVVNRQPPEPA